MLEDFFKEKIADLKSKNLYRSEKIYRSQGGDLIDFSSNDYLGLAKHRQTSIHKNTMEVVGPAY